LLDRLLAERDVGCPRCGYNLRGNRSAVCPECGATITIDNLINRPPRVDLSWAMLFAAVAGGLPDSIRNWWELIVLRRIEYGSVLDPGWRWVIGWISRAYWLSLIPVLVLLLLSRRRFVRLHPAIRWGVAIATTLLWLLGHRRHLPYGWGW